MKPARAFGLWLAVALAGQAAALRCIDAGPQVRYQHYNPAAHPLAAALVLAQALLVAIGLARARMPIDARWIPVAALVLGAGATPSRDIGAYGIELLFAAVVQVAGFGAWALAAIALSRVKRPPRLGRARLLSGWRAPAAAALLAFGIAALLSAIAYERRPHLYDEVAYLIQARYFAELRLYMPPPPVPEVFPVDLMILDSGRWYSCFPPGWPAVLAIGVALGAPWLVNPALTGVNVLLVYWLLRALHSRRAARIGAILLAISPWNLFLGMSYMSHAASLTFALLAAIGVTRARRGGRTAWPALAGLSLGMAFLIRPLEGFVLIGLLGFAALRMRPAPLAIFALSTSLACSMHLLYNRALNGDPFRFPVMDYFDRRYGPGVNALGFGPDRGLNWAIDPFPGHGLADAAVNSALNLFSVNIETFGWQFGSLLPAAAFLAFARRRRGAGRAVAVIAAVVGAHAFYWFGGGPDFGARYWFLVLVPIVFLTARAFEEFRLARPLLVWLGLATLIIYVPWRAADKYRHYLGVRGGAGEFAAGDLVVIRGKPFPDYAAVAAFNPVDVRGGGPVYIWDAGEEPLARALKVYKDRRVRMVDGPSITSSGFRRVPPPR